ncbi:MAG: ABC transporter permease [Candidatus Izemoplasmatales bacterium]|jgi:sodium transport system permease protein
MRNILTIFKKEWDRVIKDKRLVFSVILLPGLMIYILYFFIGSGLTSLYSELDERIAMVNAPQGFVSFVETITETEALEYSEINETDIEAYKEKIDNGDWELVLVFPSDFSDQVAAKEKPTVNLYYNINEIASSQIYDYYSGYLEFYQQQLAYEIYGEIKAFEQAADSLPVDQEQATGMMVSMLLPMLVLMFLFSGAMSIGPEAITGEKERGTIATLLVTPVKRNQIALGKILGLGVLSLISACSSFIGVLLSMPKLFAIEDIDISIYSVTDYLQILLILFSTVFVIVGIISVISAFAKNMKEAGTLIVPVYLLTIIIGVTSMFRQGAVSNPFLYLIPLYNSNQTMIAIFTFDPLSWLYTLISVIANIVYLILLVILLNKMFNSEKIMFSK